MVLKVTGITETLYSAWRAGAISLLTWEGIGPLESAIRAPLRHAICAPLRQVIHYKTMAFPSPATSRLSAQLQPYKGREGFLAENP